MNLALGENVPFHSHLETMLKLKYQIIENTLVLYPEEGSIAETSVKNLLNSVDFTIFKWRGEV